MLKDVVFISMDGKQGFKIGDFEIRDDISLPVYVPEEEQFTVERLTPDNIMTGMIKVLADDPENDHIDYYRSFIFSVRPDIESHISSLAYEAESNKHFEEALDMFYVLNALKPTSQEHQLNIAVCSDEYSQFLIAKGMDSDAQKYEDIAYDFFKSIEEFEDKTENTLFYLGKFYLTKENYNKALEYFNDFLDITTDEDRKKEVLQVLNDISLEGVNNDDYQYALNLVYGDKCDEAVSYIDKYVAAFPDSWNGYYLKGIALRKLSKSQEALESFNEALRLNPDSIDIFNELGLCYMNLSVFHKSEYYFYKALQKKPDDNSIIYNLALNSFKKEDLETALNYCNVILEFNPDDLNTKNLKKMIEESIDS